MRDGRAEQVVVAAAVVFGLVVSVVVMEQGFLVVADRKAPKPVDL